MTNAGLLQQAVWWHSWGVGSITAARRRTKEECIKLTWCTLSECAAHFHWWLLVLDIKMSQPAKQGVTPCTELMLCGISYGHGSPNPILRSYCSSRWIHLSLLASMWDVNQDNGSLDVWRYLSDHRMVIGVSYQKKLICSGTVSR
jgi:hypothetical protein